MKKILALTFSLLSIGFIASTAEAKAIESSNAANAGKPQVQIQIGRGRRWDRRRFGHARVMTQTRFVRYGWRTYRETYRVWYLPNGTTRTELISRERVY